MGMFRLVKPGNHSNTIHPISEDVVSELRQAQQGSRELLLQGKNTNMRLVRNAADIDRVARCPCKAAAVFDSWIHAHRAWIEPNAQGGAFASAAPKVAVGLADGTVHFMELGGDEETEMFLHERARHELDSQRSTPTAMMLPEHTSGMVLQTASHFDTKQIELSTATFKQRRFCRRKAAERCIEAYQYKITLQGVPVDASVGQDGNGMRPFLAHHVEEIDGWESKVYPSCSVNRETSLIPHLLAGAWEEAGATAFRLAEEAPDMN
jgi:hypothetical protein